ncbi:clan AA aspartic protease [Scytonema sp. NUACC26]|uniref:clan AA aspartic protease n=1 Tax=Scytonema sp. NUACC26 TaxID=3140176 RepID=UPI0034DBD3A5
MIHGTVVGLQARINIILRPSGRSDVEIECVVDTGFEGALTLPPDIVAALDLPYVTRISANLANDMNVMTRVYLATIIWHEVEREVVVLAMGRRLLIGTLLLEDYHLGVDFYEGGSVVIDEIL